VIGAQLIAHDEQDVADRAHRSGKGDFVAPASAARRCEIIRAALHSKH
jgi:hypothetical protein